MKLSLRNRLFFALSGLLLFFALLSLLSSTILLEKVYVWKKEAALIEAAKMIDDTYRGDPADLATELKRIANSLGAGIVITDQSGQIKYTSFGPFIHQQNSGHSKEGLRLPPPPPHITKSRKSVDEKTTLEMQSDPDIKIDFIVIDRRLNNRDLLHMRQALAPIADSAAVASQFVVITGLLSILVGCTWAFFFAKRFIRPILNLNRIAQRMAVLDFSQKASIERSDEVGQLGQSINHLSQRLDNAIAELNQKNRQLLADVEKERQLDRMRKEFVSNVSHELKTPLALILGYAEGLRENVAQDDQSKDYYCSVIMEEAEKMDRLVRDLLSLSQMESGIFQLTPEVFDLSVSIDELVQKYRTILTDNSITLNVTKPECCLVQADRLRVEQVLFNFLNNAIAHVGAAKTVEISLNASNDPQYFRVSVYNSGSHIPADSLDKIWTSFYKVDKARTHQDGGHGLGLSIVRAIQDLHGSGYGAENTTNGVRFWFDVQIAAPLSN